MTSSQQPAVIVGTQRREVARSLPGADAGLPALAVVVARAGELPPDAGEAIAEAGGAVLVLGEDAARAAAMAAEGARAWWCDTGPGLRPGCLAARLAPLAGGIPLLVLPGSADGRDLAPRLAATLGRPLLAGAAQAELITPTPDGSGGTDGIGRGGGTDPHDSAHPAGGPDQASGAHPAGRPDQTGGAHPAGGAGRADGPDPGASAYPDRSTVQASSADWPSGPAARVMVRASLCRLDDRVLVPTEVDGPAVVTMRPGAGVVTPPGAPAAVTPVDLPGPGGAFADAQVLSVSEPDPATMDLAEAPAVFGGGAGLAAGLSTGAAEATFGLLAGVAAGLGASCGATRVATDAGWADPDRQIGTTGVVIAPRVYVAFGVSGATQHTSGLGDPEHVVSVNLDPHCPMTARSSLGIVADARGTLTELATRLGVAVPTEVRGND